MILIITRDNDKHAERIVKFLRDRNYETLIINYAKFPSDIEISFEIDKLSYNFYIKDSSGATISGEEISSVLNRRHNFPTVPAGVASRKQYQLMVAAEVGLEIPATVIGNSPSGVINFLNRVEPPFAAKTIYSPGVRFSDEGKERRISLYTRKLSNESITSRIKTIKNCPTIIQCYIEKDFELRITIVGEKVFACAIHSQNSSRTTEDWRRYDLPNTPHKIYTLPPEVESSCKALLKKLGLPFGCIDMVVTPEGKHVFLEINPNGQWLWIEQLTGLPISESIADLLINGYCH